MNRKENTLRQAKELAEVADRTKSGFLARLSRELRTPIAVVLGYSDLLLEATFGFLTTDQTDTLQRIGRNAHELLALISAMLDLSRLEAGQLPAELQDVSHQSQPHLGWQTETDLPSACNDLGKLKTVLKNLVGDAAKFTLQGTATFDAWVSRGGSRSLSFTAG